MTNDNTKSLVCQVSQEIKALLGFITYKDIENQARLKPVRGQIKAC